MRIMGIDPSLARTGLGVIDAEPGGALTLVYQGDVKPFDGPLHHRLNHIRGSVLNIMLQLCPDAVILEQAFIGGHRIATASIAMVRGGILASVPLTAEVAEYAPMTVKKAVAGHGKAPKSDVRTAVEKVLDVKVYNEDISDALAAAITHANIAQGMTMMERLAA